jgi:hypothetical protein
VQPGLTLSLSAGGAAIARVGKIAEGRAP